jgi:hypothetical protein
LRSALTALWAFEIKPLELRNEFRLVVIFAATPVV